MRISKLKSNRTREKSFFCAFNLRKLYLYGTHKYMEIYQGHYSKNIYEYETKNYRMLKDDKLIHFKFTRNILTLNIQPV